MLTDHFNQVKLKIIARVITDSVINDANFRKAFNKKLKSNCRLINSLIVATGMELFLK